MTVAMLPDMNKARRILIIRGSAIGDVLHATPLAAALKEAFPHLEITWITEEICGDVVLGNPYLHDVIVTPRSRWKQGRLRSPQIWAEYLSFLRSLRARRFDVTIDLQGYAKSAILACASGAPYRLGWWRMRDGANLVSRPLPRRPESIHRVDWFLDVARALGAEPCEPRFALDIPDASRTYIANLLQSGGLGPDQPYAVLNQAAGDQARRWTEDGYARVAWELARRYNLPSVLVGVDKDHGPNETITAQYRALREAGHSQTPDGQKVSAPFNVAGKTTLKQLFALIDRCAIQISGDTGSLHIAAALNRPLVGLFGSSDPAHAGPWGQSEHVLSRRELCRPDCSLRHCTYNGEEGKKREKGKGKREKGTEEPPVAHCLAAITPEAIVEMVGRLLN